MTLLKDIVDLFVIGEDFYRGSTKKCLANGWCDFSVLGREQVTSFFGTSADLGTIWYLAHKVDESGLRSFEEYRRQQMWLSNQGPNVACIIIDNPRIELNRHNISTIPTSGERSHYAAENAAITGLAQAQLAHNAMLIAAEYEDRPEILSFLHQKYEGEEILLVPPDLPRNVLSTSVSLLHEDLENARLPAGRPISWNKYFRSKEIADDVKRLYEIASSELRERILATLRQLPSSQLARGDPQLNWVRQHVEKTLIADAQILEKRTAFIASKLIRESRERVLAERDEARFLKLTSIEADAAPPPVARQIRPDRCIGDGERAHCNVDRVRWWVERLQRRFQFVERVVRLEADAQIPCRPCRLLDPERAAQHFTKVLPKDRNRVVPAVLDGTYHSAGIALRINIWLSDGCTTAQRDQAIKLLKADNELFRSTTN